MHLVLLQLQINLVVMLYHEVRRPVSAGFWSYIQGWLGERYMHRQRAENYWLNLCNLAKIPRICLCLWVLKRLWYQIPCFCRMRLRSCVDCFLLAPIQSGRCVFFLILFSFLILFTFARVLIFLILRRVPLFIKFYFCRQVFPGLLIVRVQSLPHFFIRCKDVDVFCLYFSVDCLLHFLVWDCCFYLIILDYFRLICLC